MGHDGDMDLMPDPGPPELSGPVSNVRDVGTSADVIRPGDSAALRKARGAFFTPLPICRFVADWAVRTATDRVLEPSCGEAAFLAEAADTLSLHGGKVDAAQLHGVELHQGSAGHAEATLRDRGYESTIEVRDFFTTGLGQYDAVIGNPPYVRYQDFTGDARAAALAATKAAGVELSRLASSWAAFTIHAATAVAGHGRLGLVLPAELLSVNYAGPVRSYLLRRFSSVRLVLFQERVFPGVSEEVVLLLAEGDGPCSAIEVCEVANAESLTSVGCMTWRSHEPGTSSRWSAALLGSDAVSTFDNVTTSAAFTPLLEWGDPNLGIVTGNNKYFAMSPERAAELDLAPHEVIAISPPGSRHLRGLALTRRMWGDLSAAGAQTLLFRPDLDQISAGARRYIARGEADGVQDAYKCRVRKTWWQVPLVRKADLFVTCMNHDAPRLVANEVGALHLNSIHGLILRRGERSLGMRQLPIGMLNSVTLVGAELHGRSYGGGILKLEPKEADRLPVPSPPVLRAASEDLDAVRSKVTGLLGDGRFADAVGVVDQVVLPHLGVGDEDGARLQDAREYLFWRRTQRRQGGPGGR